MFLMTHLIRMISPQPQWGLIALQIVKTATSPAQKQHPLSAAMHSGYLYACFHAIKWWKILKWICFEYVHRSHYHKQLHFCLYYPLLSMILLKFNKLFGITVTNVKNTAGDIQPFVQLTVWRFYCVEFWTISKRLNECSTWCDSVAQSKVYIH